MFDQLLLIAEGRCVYYGDATSAVPYFSGKGHPCPSLYNPADFFMDVVSPDYRSKELEKASLGRIDVLSREWSIYASASPDLESRASLSSEPFSLSSSNFAIQSSWPRQFSLCFKRNVTTLSRNKTATYGKVFGGIFFGVVLGAIYSDSGYNQKSIQDRVGLLFFLTINQTFGNMLGVLNSFTAEKEVVQRERDSNSYHITSFYLAKFCAEVPFNFLGPFFTGTLVFWIVGLGGGSFLNYITFLLILSAVGFCAIALGMIIAGKGQRVAKGSSEVVPSDKAAPFSDSSFHTSQP